ncbi:hypothetical protein RclHR1_12430001 [Rhizophagus clarus]|uniref:Uncharacterized protein n=1 Tax=Rhizophagus clarus TaxID=94130 RepID=A0A2Z6QBY1_9GLOM|nr:hypothetical protein RclHR1_12430001 [Rhizophagus clarus]
MSRTMFIFSICRQPENPTTRQILGNKILKCPVNFRYCCNESFFEALPESLNGIISCTVLAITNNTSSDYLIDSSFVDKVKLEAKVNLIVNSNEPQRMKSECLHFNWNL